MFKGLMGRWREKLKRFRASERGVAAIEFAFVAPPFLMVLGVVIETGVMMLNEYVLQSSVSDASRLVRTGQAQTSPLSASDFKIKICNQANLIMNCTSNVTVYVRSEANFATLQANLPAFVSIGPTVGITTTAGNCYKTGQPSQPAAVIATYDWNFTMVGMGFLANLPGTSTRRLIGFSIFQNEPFPGTGQATC